MAQKRTDLEDFELPLDDGSEPEGGAYEASGEESSPRTRVSRKKQGVFVPLTSTGELDSARIRNPEKLEQARAALAGGSFGDGKPRKEPVDRDMVPPLLDGYAMLVAQLARLLKFPPEARALIRFDNEQKVKLTEPIGKLLDEVLPRIITENQVYATAFLALGLETKNILQRAIVQHAMSNPEVMERIRAAGLVTSQGADNGQTQGVHV